MALSKVPLFQQELGVLGSQTDQKAQLNLLTKDCVVFVRLPSRIYIVLYCIYDVHILYVCERVCLLVFSFGPVCVQLCLYVSESTSRSGGQMWAPGQRGQAGDENPAMELSLSPGRTLLLAGSGWSGEVMKHGVFLNIALCICRTELLAICLYHGLHKSVCALFCIITLVFYKFVKSMETKGFREFS